MCDSWITACQYHVPALIRSTQRRLILVVGRLNLQRFGHDYTSACRLLRIGLSMEVGTCNRGEGNILVMDIALLHCVKVNHKQCLFVVTAIYTYMCVMTKDLSFVADPYCIKELGHRIT